MRNIESLNKYLKDNFPDLQLCKPLFYNSKIGLRFEIGCPDIDYLDKRYLEFVYIRAIMLFEELFYPDTDIYLIVNTHRSIEDMEDENNMKDIIEMYLKDKDKHDKIDLIKLPYCYQEEDEEVLSITFRYCLSCKLGDIDYKEILKAIGNQDMGIEPLITDEVFFINKNNHIVYHLYDDRGLDIVANRKITLKKIYKKYNKWLLDYDGKIIDKTFN